jgi:hypothetical protein
LAVARLAGAFLAGVFLAGALLAAAFFVAATVLPSGVWMFCYRFELSRPASHSFGRTPISLVSSRNNAESNKHMNPSRSAGQAFPRVNLFVASATIPVNAQIDVRRVSCETKIHG